MKSENIDKILSDLSNNDMSVMQKMQAGGTSSTFSEELSDEWQFGGEMKPEIKELFKAFQKLTNHIVSKFGGKRDKYFMKLASHYKKQALKETGEEKASPKIFEHAQKLFDEDYPKGATAILEKLKAEPQKPRKSKKKNETEEQI